MIGKLLKRVVEWTVRQHEEAVAASDIESTKEWAIREIRAAAKDAGSTISLGPAVTSYVDQCVREQLAAAINAKTIDLQAAHAEYVEKYAKHATYGDPSRPIVGVTSAGRGYHYQSGLINTRKADQ
jgi:hypothetical protein